MLVYVLLATPLIASLLLLCMRRQISWRPFIEAIAAIAALIECVAGLLITDQVLRHHHYNVTSYFSIDALSALILAITVIAGFITTLHLIGYLRAEMHKDMIGMKRLHQCYLLTQLFFVSMFVATITTSPIIMWLFIEATSLSTVFLISFFSRSSDIEAGWKYLIINSIGLLLGLLGTLLFLSQVPHGSLTTWGSIMAAAHHMNSYIVKAAFVLILVGYGTKMGLVPMHTWRPDAYNKAPLPIAGMLSGPLLNIAFLAILRFKLITDIAVGSGFVQALFIFFGVLSIAVPALIIYSQTNYKRALAYSSTEQAGIMFLGIAFGGVGVLGSLLQMIYHSLCKVPLFLLSSNIAVHYSSSKIKEVTGVLRTMPYTATLYIISFLGLLGLPPFGMFISELYIILAGFSHYAILTLVVIALMVIVFVGFARQILSMMFGEPPKDIERANFSLWVVAPVTVLIALFFVLSVYLPNGLQTLLHESVRTLGRRWI